MANTNCVEFTSASSTYVYIDDGDQTGLDLSGDFTISFWIKFKTFPGTGNEVYLVSKGTTGGAAGTRGYNVYFLDTAADRLGILTYSSSNATANSYWTPSFVLNTWYHVIITCDVSNAVATRFECFVNGVTQGNGTTGGTDIASINNNAEPFVIGAKDTTPNNPANVFMDHVQIYNTVESASTVFQYSTSSTVRDNLQGFWLFDNDLTDQSGNGNTLTNSSSTFSTNVLFDEYGLLTKFSPAMDGHIVDQGSTTWTTNHGAATGDSAGTAGTTVRASVEIGQAGANAWSVWRTFMSFDTSTIDDDATVASAFIVFTLSAVDHDISWELGLTNPTPASDTALVTADFDQCGSINSPTEGASRIASASLSGGATFLLNSTGLGWVNLTGYTHLGMRSADDFSDSTPAHTGSQRTLVDIRSQENTSANNRPWFGVVTEEPVAEDFVPQVIII